MTNQGTNFISMLIQLFQKHLGISAIKNMPCHPRADGLVKWFNQTLKMLQKFVDNTGKDLDCWLPFLFYVHTKVPHASTEFF